MGILVSKEHPAEAISWCQKAATLRPDEPKYAYTLAFFQKEQGKTNDAIQTLEKLIQQAPPHAEAYALLAQIYEEQNKVADAVSVCRRAVGNEKLGEQQRARFEARLRALAPN